METAQQTLTLATADYSLLAYAQHMAATARCEAAKRMFEECAAQEQRRLERMGALRRPAHAPMSHRLGEPMTASAKESAYGEKRTEGGVNMRRSKQPTTETMTRKNGAKLFTFNAEPHVKEVRLAGDFNGWDPEGLPMAKRAGMFVKRVELNPGEHQYKFLVDGQWMADPAAEMQVPNGLGSMNSVVRV